MHRRIVSLVTLLLGLVWQAWAQVNTNHMMWVGVNALYYNDYVLAIKYFNQAINAKPYLAEAYSFRSEAKYHLGDYVGAEKDAATAIELNPFIPYSYEYRSLALSRLKRYGEAIDNYKVLLKMLPDNPGIWHNYALFHYRMNDFDGAMAAIDTLRAKAPNNTVALHLRSTLLKERGDTLGAIAALDTVLMIDKYDHAAYMDRSIINIGLKKFEEVESDLTQAIHLFPMSGHYINRSIAREELVWLATCPKLSPVISACKPFLTAIVSEIFIINLRISVIIYSSGQFL